MDLKAERAIVDDDAREEGSNDASDESLVERARAGEKRAFDALVRRHQEKVYSLALRLSGSERDAEEVLQETFLQIYRKLDSFRGESRFSTWLFRIAANGALMHRRAKARRQTESLEEYLPKFNEAGRLERLDLDYGRAARADDLLERRELRQQVLEAIDRLPETYRATFTLRDLEELSTEETAEVLDLDPTVVRTRLHRARLMMRGFLGAVTGGER
jgi:RNA polymerase sigma-70 factor (ECF subfamily)